MSEVYCNNCGKPGHIYNQCKVPITSFGVIAFRYNLQNKIEYLMIRRKDTLGYIDFMRGKYMVHNKHFILNQFKQMTVQEKEKLLCGNFDKLWRDLWGDNLISNKYRTEEHSAREKYNQLFMGINKKTEFYNLHSIIEECKDDIWEEPEWGFPKGRREYQEKDYDCALREFYEETGFNGNKLKNLQNIFPFEENFTGSNYKSYKHKYYLMMMNYEDSILQTTFEKTEVSKMEWKEYDDCIQSIRSYNLEKRRMITNIHNCLQKYTLFLC